MSDLIALNLSIGWGWACTCCAVVAGDRGFAFLAMAALPLLIWARHAPARRVCLAACGTALVPGLLIPAGPAACVLGSVLLSSVIQSIFRSAPVNRFSGNTLLAAFLTLFLLAPALFLCAWPGPTLSRESLGWAVAGSFACGAAFALLEWRIRRSSALRHALQRP